MNINKITMTVLISVVYFSENHFTNQRWIEDITTYVPQLP